MTVPGELQRSLPRPVSFTTRGKINVAVFVVAMLALSAGIVQATAVSLRDSARLTRHASGFATAAGTVLSPVRRSSRRSTKWVVAYEFSIGGVVRRGEMTTDGLITNGASVKIGYMPADPADNWAIGYEPGEWKIWSGPAFFGFGLLLIIYAMARILRLRHLLVYGCPTIAQTVGEIQSYVTRSGTRYRLKCEFRSPGGVLCTATIVTGNETVATSPEIVILYDPEKPKRVTAYPIALFEVVSY